MGPESSVLPSEISTSGDEYVVLFDPNHPEPPEIAEVMKKVGLSPDHPDVKYIFSNSAFKGFVGTMPHASASTLNDLAFVQFVEQPVRVSSTSLSASGNSPWGLERISSAVSVSGDPTALTYTYHYDPTGNLGRGVDIYILDSGINTVHTAFGGRAVNGWSYNGDLSPSSDSYGHGTHVAGTAGAQGFGVAQAANLIGVKVLDGEGSGMTSDIVKGLDWIVNQHDKKRAGSGFIGSIASMSWAVQAKSSTLEQAIKLAISSGIHASLVAGNDGEDACAHSPSLLGGSQGSAVVVGAMNIDDTISSFSNTGNCVDVFAPGESIKSTWIGSSTATKIEQGTSMACPHVTGMMAYLMGKDASLRQDPAKMKALIGGSALASALLRSPKTIGGLNKLANNGVPYSVQDQPSNSPSAVSTVQSAPATTPAPIAPPAEPDSNVVTIVRTVIVPSPTGIS